MELIDDFDKSDVLIYLDKLDVMDIKDLYRQAVNYFISGERKAAYLMFKKVVENDPAYVHDDPQECYSDTAYYYLGACYERNFKDLDGAIELYTKAIELCPNDFASWKMRSFCHMQKGEYEKAVAGFEKIIRDKLDAGPEADIVEEALGEAKKALKKKNQ